MSRVKSKSEALNLKKLIIMLLFTALFLFIFKMGYYVTLPFIDSKFQTEIDFGFINAISGGALQHFSILCLGISPYITASIVVQLLQMDIIPVFKEWGEEGESGKQKLNQVTRYMAIGLAIVQSLILVIGVDNSYNGLYWTTRALETSKAIKYIYLAIVATGGTAFCLWLAELITKHGIGNGTSMLICAGILASFPNMIKSLVSTYISTEETRNIGLFIFVIVMLLLIIVFIVFMEAAQRKIPIQYANRPAAASFRGKNDSNIPIKLNSASVIPVIFASTLMSLPTTIIQLVKGNDSSQLEGGALILYRIFSTTYTTSEGVTKLNVGGFSLYILLIFIFSFFYSFLQMNPEKMSDNLQKQNAYIPGVRPGEDTTSYISRVLFKITMIGATYLTLVAIIPILLTVIFQLPTSVTIGGTSLIIVVGVAVETALQLKTQQQDKQYRGFME